MPENEPTRPPRPAPPPNSAAAAAIADAHDGSAVVLAQGVPPSPGAPDADKNNVMTIFVPADNTCLQMGAASQGPSPNVPAISGFRVSTLSHAHVTAQDPLSTVSLGKPGGEGMGGVSGLSIYTAGQKDERVDLKVTETYNNEKTETIVGPLGVKVTGGDAKYDYAKKLDISCLERKETVTTEWKGEFGSLEWHSKGEAKIKADADTFLNWNGDKHEEVLGFSNELRVGGENKQIIGQKSETIVIGEMKTVIGEVLETRMGQKLEITAGPVYEMHPFKTGLSIEKAESVSGLKSDVAALQQEQQGLTTVTAGLCKKNFSAELKQHGVGLLSSDAEVISATATIIK